MPGRHVHAPSEGLDVERLRVLAIDPVAHATQEGEITQTLIGDGSTGHVPMVPRSGVTIAFSWMSTAR